MQTPDWLRRWDVRTVFLILGVIVVPSALTLSTVQVPTQPLDFNIRSAPYGYTVSLLIYLVPVFAINWWFRRKYRETDGVDDRRSAFRWTLITLIPIGFLLDIVFGYEFLTFPNPSAILPLPLFWSVSFTDWSLVKHIPIEEFAFYTLGFIAILSSYIWCDEFWLSRYNEPDFGRTAKNTPVVQVQLAGPVTIAVVSIAAGVLYKKMSAHPEGFPSYFSFLVLASIIPSILFFRSVKPFVNWRAVSFTVMWVVLTSLIWEATLAAPYGWWGYNEYHMLGLFIDAWAGLPFEAALLWMSVTFTTVIVYEMYKILIVNKRVNNQGWWETFFGPRRGETLLT